MHTELYICGGFGQILHYFGYYSKREVLTGILHCIFQSELKLFGTTENMKGIYYIQSFNILMMVAMAVVIYFLALAALGGISKADITLVKGGITRHD